MSELTKKLEQLSSHKKKPLGFGTSTQSNREPIILIAHVHRPTANLIDMAISERAGALLFDYAEIELFSQIALSIEEIPWGILMDATHVNEIDEFCDLGCDYVIFKSEVPAQILGESRMGKVLQIDTTLSDSMVKTIGRLSIDAIMLDMSDELPLTLYRLMQLQRLVSLAGKPTLSLLPEDLRHIRMLRDIGVGGMVVNFDDERGKEILHRAKETIQKLPEFNKKVEESSQ